MVTKGFPGGAVVKNPPANARGHEFWALVRVEQLNPGATTTEAHTPRARAPQQKKPPQWERQRRVSPVRHY